MIPFKDCGIMHQDFSENVFRIMEQYRVFSLHEIHEFLVGCLVPLEVVLGICDRDEYERCG